MTDKNQMIEKTNSLYSGNSKNLKVTVKGSGSNPVEFGKLTELMRGSTGLSQTEAGRLIWGSVENYQSIDPSGSKTRGKARDAWRSINPKVEVSVAHTRSDAGQTYFIVSAENYKHWYSEYSGFGEKFDSGKHCKNDPDVMANLKRS